jgi:phage recombination protein Bet
MSQDIAIKDSYPALAMDEQELLDVLRNSLYPGAQDASIKLAMGYCRASGLDPMLKPVHIVSMWDSKSGGMRDVIMPGIGLYRTQAARSGSYAGISDAEYGPDVTENIGGTDITYPLWCRVTVKRLMPDGQIAEFTATERWKENYAVRGGKDKSIAPNAMWFKRPYGQISKCTEAQALRKAFPESGSQPTSDEMEGKSLDNESTIIDGNTGEVLNKKPERTALPACTDESFSIIESKHKSVITSGEKTPDALINWLQAKCVLTAAQESTIKSWGVENEPA